MSKWLIEFVMKKSIEVSAFSLEGAIEEATTWINHEEFLDKHKLKDLGFKIVMVKGGETEGMDFGPRKEEKGPDGWV